MVTEAEYSRLLVPHKRSLAQLRMWFGYFVEDIEELDLYGVQSRIKTYRSAMAKANECGRSVDDLPDLAAMRVIVGTREDIPVVERFFTRQEFGKDLVILENENLERADGYRARHILVELPGNYQTSVFKGRVEIQVVTVFSHAYNFLSRSWVYKKASVPQATWFKRFERISCLLGDLEAEASRLRLELIEKNAEDGGCVLAPQSYRLLVREEFGEEVAIGDAVDACRLNATQDQYTVQQFRAYLQSPKIRKAYDAMKAGVRHREDEGVRFLQEMNKLTFWSIFGKHEDGGNELICGLLAALPEDNG